MRGGGGSQVSLSLALSPPSLFLWLCFGVVRVLSCRPWPPLRLDEVKRIVEQENEMGLMEGGPGASKGSEKSQAEPVKLPLNKPPQLHA